MVLVVTVFTVKFIVLVLQQPSFSLWDQWTLFYCILFFIAIIMQISARWEKIFFLHIFPSFIIIYNLRQTDNVWFQKNVANWLPSTWPSAYHVALKVTEVGDPCLCVCGTWSYLLGSGVLARWRWSGSSECGLWRSASPPLRSVCQASAPQDTQAACCRVPPAPAACAAAGTGRGGRWSQPGIGSASWSCTRLHSYTSGDTPLWRDTVGEASHQDLEEDGEKTLVYYSDESERMEVDTKNTTLKLWGWNTRAEILTVQAKNCHSGACESAGLLFIYISHIPEKRRKVFQILWLDFDIQLRKKNIHNTTQVEN